MQITVVIYGKICGFTGNGAYLCRAGHNIFISLLVTVICYSLQLIVTYAPMCIQMECRVHRFIIDNNSNVGKRLSILHMYLCRIGRSDLTSWQLRFELLPYVNPKIPEYCRQNFPLKILKKILHKIDVVLALLTFLALFCDW